MPKLNTLNRRQQLFCQYLAEGESQARAYLKAGFKANTIQQAGSNAIRLMRTERVMTYLGKIKEIVFKNQVLSFNEKRAIISRMVKAAPSEVGADSPLAQSYTEEVDVQGNVKRKVVLPDKARLIDLDNRMSGDNFADRSPQVSNPFTLIIALGKTPAQGQALDDARQAASVGSLPHPPAIEAELVE
jgi:Terminase small subunit